MTPSDEGFSGWGFYDIVTEKIIEQNTTYKIKDGVLEGTVLFQQNFKEEKNYLLLVFMDYKQQDFSVGEQVYQNYAFSLTGDTEIEIDISVNTNNAKEFTYFIIKEPGETNFMKEGEYQWDTMLELRNPFVYRLSLEYEAEKEVEKEASWEDINLFQWEGDFDGFEIVESHNDPKAIVEGRSGKTVELIILNQHKQAMEKELHIMAFLDWKQIPFKESEDYNIKIPIDQSGYIKFELPKVEKPSVFHIRALEYPYQNLDEVSVGLALDTFRILIIP